MRRIPLMSLLLLSLVLLLALPALGQTGSLSEQIICLDPGHGGSDPGAVYSDSTLTLHEADINLDVAFGLKLLLEGDGATVLMTRTDGVADYSNRDRYTFCNQMQATLLVSVHTNSTTDPTVDGAMILYFKPEDRVLGQAIYDVMYPYLRDRAPNPATFIDYGLSRFASGVLLKSDMPAAMMEPVLMSNPAEAALLAQPLTAGGAFDAACGDLSCRRGQIAHSIHQGLLVYVTPPGDPTPTPTPDPTATPEPGGSMTVADVQVSVLQRGKNLKGAATVWVVDEAGSAVVDATVTGDWLLNGVIFNWDSGGTTSSDGSATISSSPIREVQAGDQVSFCVSDVSHAGLVYTAPADPCATAIVP